MIYVYVAYNDELSMCLWLIMKNDFLCMGLTMMNNLKSVELTMMNYLCLCGLQ